VGRKGPSRKGRLGTSSRDDPSTATTGHRRPTRQDLETVSTAIKQRRPVPRAFLSGMAASLLEGVSPVARTIVGITWLAFAAVAAFALRTQSLPGVA